LFLARFEGGETVAHSLRPGRHAWLHVAEGVLIVNGQRLEAGDAMAASDEPRLELTAKGAAQVLLFDLN
jgi:hypothetical protein